MSKVVPSSHRIYPAYCFPAAKTFKKWVKFTAADVQALRQEPGFEGQNVFFHLNHPIEFVYLIGPVVAVDHLVTRYNTRFTLLEIDDGSGTSIEVKISYKAPSANLPGGPTVVKPHLAVQPSREILENNVDADSLDKDDEDDDKDELHDCPDPLDDSSNPGAKTLFTTRIFETTVEGLTVKAGPRGTDLLLRGEPIDVGTVLKVKGTLQRWRDSFQLNLRRAFVVRSVDEEVLAWRDYAEFTSTVLSKPWVLSDEELAALEKADRDNTERERKQAERRSERERDKAERRRVWEEKRARYERHAEKKRLKEAEELDGNALDRPGWKPYVPQKAARREKHAQQRSWASLVAPIEDEKATGGNKRSGHVGITTAKAVWQHEQQQQHPRQAAYQAGPARWQHEYAGAKPPANDEKTTMTHVSKSRARSNTSG